jgi:uncharacterized membrane protein
MVMKRLVTLMAAAAVVAFSGCGAKSSSPGGNPSKKDEQVTLKIGLMEKSITLHQGEAKNITLTLDRGKEFKQDITLTAKVDPKSKLEVDPESKEVKASDTNEVTFNIKAAKDSPEGDHEVQFSAKVKGGADPSPVAVKVTVKAKK